MNARVKVTLPSLPIATPHFGFALAVARVGPPKPHTLAAAKKIGLGSMFLTTAHWRA